MLYLYPGSRLYHLYEDQGIKIHEQFYGIKKNRKINFKRKKKNEKTEESQRACYISEEKHGRE